MPKEASAFVLRVGLGNDAMQTYGDIADALIKVAQELQRDAHKVATCDELGAIRDVNGNRVGSWHTQEG